MHKVMYGGRDCDIGCENVQGEALGLNELSQAKMGEGLSLEKMQGGRYDELQMLKVLYDGVDCDNGCENVQGEAECETKWAGEDKNKIEIQCDHKKMTKNVQSVQERKNVCENVQSEAECEAKWASEEENKIEIQCDHKKMTKNVKSVQERKNVSHSKTIAGENGLLKRDNTEPSTAHKGGKGEGPPQGTNDQYTCYQDTRPPPNTNHQPQPPTNQTTTNISHLEIIVGENGLFKKDNSGLSTASRGEKRPGPPQGTSDQYILDRDTRPPPTTTRKEMVEPRLQPHATTTKNHQKLNLNHKSTKVKRKWKEIELGGGEKTFKYITVVDYGTVTTTNEMRKEMKRKRKS